MKNKRNVNFIFFLVVFLGALGSDTLKNTKVQTGMETFAVTSLILNLPDINVGLSIPLWHYYHMK